MMLIVGSDEARSRRIQPLLVSGYCAVISVDTNHNIGARLSGKLCEQGISFCLRCIRNRPHMFGQQEKPNSHANHMLYLLRITLENRLRLCWSRGEDV